MTKPLFTSPHEGTESFQPDSIDFHEHPCFYFGLGEFHCSPLVSAMAWCGLVTLVVLILSLATGG